jgi:hypothetical protein
MFKDIVLNIPIVIHVQGQFRTLYCSCLGALEIPFPDTLLRSPPPPHLSRNWFFGDVPEFVSHTTVHISMIFVIFVSFPKQQFGLLCISSGKKSYLLVRTPSCPLIQMGFFLDLFLSM